MIFVLLLYIPECCKTLAMKKILLLTVLCLSAVFSFGQYCAPSFAGAYYSCYYYGMHVDSFSLVGTSGSIMDRSGCDGSGYLDMTALSCNLNAGSIYVATLSMPGSYSMSGQVWIDFNHDGSFSSAESVGGFGAASGIIAFNITVPSGISGGTTRMRIAVNDVYYGGGVYPTISPCGGYYYGEDRDYTVMVSGPMGTIAPATVSFPATLVSTTSSAAICVFDGAYLIPASGALTVTAPSNFEVCSTAGGTFVSSYTISYSGATASASSIYVKFNAPATAGTYSGSVCVTGGGLSAVCGALSGTAVSSACSGTPSAGTASSSVSIASIVTPITLTDTGYTTSAGIALQWQYSATGSSWTDISGATSNTWSFAGITANSYYRCTATCAASGVTSSTAPVLITYTATCSGTPAGGTAASSTYSCTSCTATLTLSGSTTGMDILYQWQRSPDGSSSWANLSSASTTSSYTFTPNGDYFYRCAVKCVASGLTGYSSVVHIAYPYHIIGHSVTDSTSALCNGPLFYVMANGNSPLLYIKTWYGDGQNDSVHLTGMTTAIANTYHVYSYSGAYSVKQVLYFNNVPQDSLSFTHHYIFCRTLPVSFFIDVNGDGVKNAGDVSNTRTVTVRIDSNGVPVDSATCTSGFYYTANGPAGTVYSFRVLSPVGSGYYLSVPSSGVIYDTIVVAVNTYVTKDFGFSCPASGGYDLVEHASFAAGPHAAGGTIDIRNLYCDPQSPVVTLAITPKYEFYSSNLAPYSVVGNLVTWHLGSMTAATYPYLIGYTLNKPTGSADRHPGDTVQNFFRVIPDSSDLDTTNNYTSKIDTIRGSYDPNFIQSNPSGYIAAGTLLHYTAGFENDGNDTAHNIYVLDTLSGYLEASTFKAIWSSHEMHTELHHVGGMTIVKFDFPNIQLLDSSHHDFCQGTFAYDIMAKPGLPNGTIIPARVGIYFDGNEVVMTNEEHNIIGIPANVGVTEVGAQASVNIYPNPATDMLTIETDNFNGGTITITNSIGTQIRQQKLDATKTHLNIRELSPGIYYVKISGAGNSVVRKLLKL